MRRLLLVKRLLLVRPLVLIFFVVATAIVCVAGGPIVVGGPVINGKPFGTDGKPITWNPAAMPIRYRVDPGPMAATIDNARGLQRVQSMFGVWAAVPTANLSFANAGPLLPAGSYTSGDLKTAQQFNDVMGSCAAGSQSPVIFDADGKIMAALGVSDLVIGFMSGCKIDTLAGFMVTNAIIMNGEWQDGVSNVTGTRINGELTANQFDEAITHEIGHFLGLDHSQINVEVLNVFQGPCASDDLAGLPLMFPETVCDARKDAGLPVVAPDDEAWISALYPNSSYVSSYGTISGTIFFSDGVSQFQGANVIARLVDDPTTPEDESRRVAVSVVSGFRFTGNPGQSVTGDNVNGSVVGSRNPDLIGYYELHLPPGTYTIEVETINDAFVGGSSVGPLPAPVITPPEFWNQDESAFDIPQQRDTITVHAGDNITDIDIILNTQPAFNRFDSYEDEGEVRPRVPITCAEQVSA